MSKARTPAAVRAVNAGLFRHVIAPIHRTLFLPRFLAASADQVRWDTPIRTAAHKIIVDWAKLEPTGALQHKETALDADFLEKIFGQAPGYASVTDSPNDYQRQKQFSVPGIGQVDGAIGFFTPTDHGLPTAVIELKGAETDLDHDKDSKHRTAVQQCWEYLKFLPGCPWGIVSNYITIRIYHRDRTPNAYEEFHFQDMIDPGVFNRFWYIFHRDGLLGNKVEGPRALALLKQTRDRQKEAGDDLYAHYSTQREALIRHLIDGPKLGYDAAIAAAQKLLDRVVFIAFCAKRGLLPDTIIETAIKERPTFSRVTNPIWANFKMLFGWIDKGNEKPPIPPFNGGLFAHDQIVDNLELADDWTTFFKIIDGYDFRDEVTVEVLGHLFERSITELEKLRVTGFFGPQRSLTGQPEMPKSAQRKRFGVYYTPPDFTRLIVDRTVGELIRLRVDPLGSVEAKLAALRSITVCDPACGSGAFLIAAYERLHDAYGDLVRQLRIIGDEKTAAKLLGVYPDFILCDNLYGVDLSLEAVEITQLALWIRSARPEKTLADLSANIRCGNSLVSDSAVHLRAFNWKESFPGVFARGGFDCVIGNPPRERIKQQKREFFSLVPEVILESHPAKARALIELFAESRPDLYTRWEAARRSSEVLSKYLRKCGEYGLTARGDLNTYMVFAELAVSLVDPQGRIVMLLPSGIATDATTRHLFADLMKRQSIIGLYDFENQKGHFQDVHRAFKFSVLLLGGSAVKTVATDFVFFAHDVEDLTQPDRHIELSAKDLRLLNPNTLTSPIFRTRRDAQLTKDIYSRIPVLVDKSRKAGGNSWGVRFWTMFHQSGDWVADGQRLLPLYKAKMVQMYDHRAASIETVRTNWLRHGQTAETSPVEHQNPEFRVVPRLWANEEAVLAACAGVRRWGFIAFKDISSATNQRTMIAAALPFVAVTHHLPLVDTPFPPRRQLCLLANFNALIFDFVARQKLGGTTFGFYHLALQR